jgi:hypothetical protein
MGNKVTLKARKTALKMEKDINKMNKKSISFKL